MMVRELVVDIPITQYATGNELTQHGTQEIAARGQSLVLHLLYGAGMNCAG